MPDTAGQKRSLFHWAWIGVPLRRTLPRVLFALAIAWVVLPLGYEAVRIGAAAALSARGQETDVSRAMAFDPASPRLYEQMGQIERASSNAGTAESIPWFRKAVELEPDSGFYWENLGQTCQFAGDQQCASDSFSRALQLGPMSPRVLWLAANQDLLVDSAGTAASRFRHLLALDPTYADAVFAICLRAYGNPRFLEERILPSGSSSALRLSFVAFLTKQGDFWSANRIWKELVSARTQLDFSLTDPYLEKLISAGRIAQAVEVWRDLQRLGTLPGAGSGETDNLVFNPGFERKPLNAGFGWRSPNVPYVNAEFADPSAHRGNRCLRIDYVSAENQASEPVYELIPVSGSQTYRLTAWVRSQAVASDSGPRLRLADPGHADCPQAETSATVGTTPWHPVSLTFSTCSQTKLIRLWVWRPRANDFSNTIEGHFWLDDVTLEPVNRSDLPLSHTRSR